MSNKALTWAFAQSTGNPGRKAVLVALADMADDSHSCWPRQSILAAMTDQSVRSVGGHLAELARLGLVVREHRYVGGRRIADRYVLPVSVAVGVAIPQPADPARSQPADPATRQDVLHAESVKPTGRICVARTPIEPKETPTVSQPRASKSNRGTRLPDDWRRTAADVQWQAAQEIPDDFAREHTAEFRDYWKAKAGAGGVKLDWSATWRNWMRRAWRGRDGDTYRLKAGLGGPPVRDFAAEREAARLERERARFRTFDPLASAR